MKTSCNLSLATAGHLEHMYRIVLNVISVLPQCDHAVYDANNKPIMNMSKCSIWDGIVTQQYEGWSENRSTE
jgi:hypothetical protein